VRFTKTNNNRSSDNGDSKRLVAHVRMRSHLERFREWPPLARAARYRAKGLAGLCQVSPRHLTRYFREQFGRTPQEWLDGLRIHEASDLLRGGKQVKEVAFELGFCHASHFIRKFKEYYHCTPFKFSISGWGRKEWHARCSSLGPERP